MSPTILDLLAESQSDRRGKCPKCKRDEDVPLNESGICLPCYMETPGLSDAIDVVAQRKLDAMLGKEPDPSEQN